MDGAPCTAQAGGENDERRPVVSSLTSVRKLFLECPQDGTIGVGVPTYPGAFAWVGDLYSKRLDVAIPALVLVALYRWRPAQRYVEELELIQIDVGPFASRSGS